MQLEHLAPITGVASGALCTQVGAPPATPIVDAGSLSGITYHPELATDTCADAAVLARDAPPGSAAEPSPGRRAPACPLLTTVSG